MGTVTIHVTPGVKDALENLGRKGQTFDSIIRDLLAQTGVPVGRDRRDPPGIFSRAP